MTDDETEELAEGAMRCDDCGEVQDEPEPGYECSSCGHQFMKSDGEGNGNICPECHKFASKIGANVCPNCFVVLVDPNAEPQPEPEQVAAQHEDGRVPEGYRLDRPQRPATGWVVVTPDGRRLPADRTDSAVALAKTDAAARASA